MLNNSPRDPNFLKYWNSSTNPNLILNKYCLNLSNRIARQNLQTFVENEVKGSLDCGLYICLRDVTTRNILKNRRYIKRPNLGPNNEMCGHRMNQHIKENPFYVNRNAVKGKCFEDKRLMGYKSDFYAAVISQLSNRKRHHFHCYKFFTKSPQMNCFKYKICRLRKLSPQSIQSSKSPRSTISCPLNDLISKMEQCSVSDPDRKQNCSDAQIFRQKMSIKQSWFYGFYFKPFVSRFHINSILFIIHINIRLSFINSKIARAFYHIIYHVLESLLRSLQSLPSHMQRLFKTMPRNDLYKIVRSVCGHRKSI